MTANKVIDPSQYAKPVTEFIRAVENISCNPLLHAFDEMLDGLTPADRAIQAATPAMKSLSGLCAATVSCYGTPDLHACRLILKLARMIERARDSGRFRKAHEYEDIWTEVEAECLRLELPGSSVRTPLSRRRGESPCPVEGAEAQPGGSVSSACNPGDSGPTPSSGDCPVRLRKSPAAVALLLQDGNWSEPYALSGDAYRAVQALVASWPERCKSDFLVEHGASPRSLGRAIEAVPVLKPYVIRPSSPGGGYHEYGLINPWSQSA